MQFTVHGGAECLHILTGAIRILSLLEYSLRGKSGGGTRSKHESMVYLSMFLRPIKSFWLIIKPYAKKCIILSIQKSLFSFG